MRLLLDTHVVVWSLYKPNRLPPALRTLLRRQDAGLVVSAASLWEAAIKRAKGHFPEIDEGFPSDISRAGMEMLDIRAAHAWKVRELPMIHRDPFDRLIVAQAMVEDLVLVTDDGEMARYGAAVIRA